MVRKSVISFLTFSSLLLMNGNALASSCFSGQTGAIQSVEIEDDGIHFSVSFGSNDVRMWHHLGEDAGRGALDVLNTGYATSSDLTVTKCTNGSISAFKLTRQYTSPKAAPAK